MKTTLSHQACLLICAGCLITAITAGAPARAAAAESDPTQYRASEAQPEKGASALKADREAERARAAVRESLEARAKAERMARTESARPAEGDQLERLRRQREEALKELKQLRTEDKDEEAMEVKNRIQKIERQIQRLEQQRSNGRRGPVQDQERPGRSDEAQRMEHLQAAIKNLHAAGMHDLADRLAQQEQPGPVRRPKANADDQVRTRAAGVEVQQLREEVQQLRQAVRELRAQMEGGLRPERDRR